MTRYKKSVDFYETHFGFDKYSESEVPVPEIEKIVYLKLGDTVLELIHCPADKNPQQFHFCLRSDDFEADYQRLVEAGIPVDTEPHPTGAREAGEEDWSRAVFIGPDEELIEIRG